MGTNQPVSVSVPQTQTVALVSKLGGEVEFREGYPVPTPGQNEVLAKVLYTGVCQSGKYTSIFFTP
jgi:Zn-dependent alcohol dehydrogenase